MHAGSSNSHQCRETRKKKEKLADWNQNPKSMGRVSASRLSPWPRRGQSGQLWPQGPGAPGKEEDFGLHLVVIAVSQQGHKDAKASEVYNLLAEFIPNSQARQGAAEFAQDPWVVRECCAEAGSES